MLLFFGLNNYFYYKLSIQFIFSIHYYFIRPTQSFFPKIIFPTKRYLSTQWRKWQKINELGKKINEWTKKYKEINPHLEYARVLNLNPLQNDFHDPKIGNRKRDRLFFYLLIGRDIAEVEVYVDVNPALRLHPLGKPGPPVLGVAERLERRDVRHELIR